MKGLALGLGLLMIPSSMLGEIPRSASVLDRAGGEDPVDFVVDLDHAGISTYRLELFERTSGERVYDSGLVSEGSISIDLEPGLRDRASDLSIEVRGWDGQGQMVFSQLSALGGDEIFSIGFEVIPAGVEFQGSAIGFQGNVDITGSLDVSGGVDVGGSVSTTGLLNGQGGNFFGSCPSGQFAQGINSNGSFICGTDQTGGGGGGDNLGNHIATQDIQIGFNTILSSGGSTVLRSSNNAQLATGPEGRTFHLRAGDSGADSGQFWDSNGGLRLRVANDGLLHFTTGQKLCTLFHPDWGHNTVLASGNWTATNCRNFQNAVTGLNDYQLGCMFDWGVSFGQNGGVPPQNCGW